MRRLLLLAVACVGFASVASLAGAEPDPKSGGLEHFASPTREPLIRLALAVACVSAVGLGLALWSRRRRAFVGEGNSRIEVLATRSLGPRHQVALVAFGDHRLLVGMGGDSITTLADLTAETIFSDELAKSVPIQGSEDSRAVVDPIGHFEGLDA